MCVRGRRDAGSENNNDAINIVPFMRRVYVPT